MSLCPASFLLGFTVLVLPILARQYEEYYCRLSSRHTLCSREGPGPACRGGHISRGVSNEEAAEIVGLHNKFRSLVARGQEGKGRPGPQPSASNMKQMFWDPELAKIAQRHTDQCQFDHDCLDCRTVSRFEVGQNLYIYKQTFKSSAPDWYRAVKDWYDEVRLFSKYTVEPFRFKSDIGHYSQMMWADTDRVGCGVTSYRQGRWFASLYTCNYGPGGNYISGQMYRKGRSCSACPPNTSCSSQYPGLCL